ncbi:MAG: hypothetical protein U5K54_04760 [Cytophagales bacterium]|nr:hypothetical protein [Cytophagales bacterium]
MEPTLWISRPEIWRFKETTKPVSAKGTITIKEGKVNATTKFNLALADYGIAFKKGKPSTNIAKEIRDNRSSGLPLRIKYRLFVFFRKVSVNRRMFSEGHEMM